MSVAAVPAMAAVAAPYGANADRLLRPPPPSRPLRVLVRAADPVRALALLAQVRTAGHLAAMDDDGGAAQSSLGLDAGPGTGLEPDAVVADAPGEYGAPLLLVVDGPVEGPISALPPSASPAQLDAALRAVAAGLLVRLPQAVAAAAQPGFQAADPSRALLTPREIEILACLSQGMSNKAAARQLGISAHTVKFHLESVFAKLGATSRADAVARGLRRGVIEM